MKTACDATDLAARALELERFLPDGRRNDFRQLVTELFAVREVLDRERDDLATAHRLQTGETARLRERVSRLNRQLAFLEDIFRANDQAFATFRAALGLSRGLRSLEKLPDMLARLARTMDVGALSCLLGREEFAALVPQDIPCRPQSALGLALGELPRSDPGRRVYVGSLRSLPRPDFFFDSAVLQRTAGLAGGSCFIAPLADKYRPDRLIGILALADADPERYAVNKGTDFLEHFCEVLAGDLQHVKNHEALLRERESDELTGIPNRVALRRHGPALLELAGRKGTPAALLFCDLDRFKAVNDTFGHELGDAVLRDVARAMAQKVRPYDLLARLGGDEFVLLLPDAGPDVAHGMANRLRDCVDRVARERNLSGTPGLSVSIGVAVHIPGEGIDDLVRRADAAMYADKRGDPPQTP